MANNQEEKNPLEETLPEDPNIDQEPAAPDPFEEAALEEQASKETSEDDSVSPSEDSVPVQTDATGAPDNKNYEKLLKKQEKQAVKAAKKNLKEEEEAKKKAEQAAAETEKAEEPAPETETTPESSNAPSPEPPSETAAGPAPGGTGTAAAATMQRPAPAPRGKYARVLTTGQYIGAFVLMLIPGINIICVLVWALGGAKNPNKVNFVRGCIVFFLIEIVLCALIFGGTYIYVNQNQTKYLNELNTYTNGLLDYFDIRSYKELDKLKDTSKYLIPKNTPLPENKRVRATRVVENPAEIKTYNDFVALYKTYKPGSVTEAKIGKSTQTDEKGYYIGEQFSGTAKNLVNFMKKYHVDATTPGLVYIVIDNNGSDNCVIAFDPTGTLQKVPTIRVNNETIFVGGVN